MTTCKTSRSVERTGLPERFGGSRTASSSIFGVQVLNDAGFDWLPSNGLVLPACEAMDKERLSVSVPPTGFSTLGPGWGGIVPAVEGLEGPAWVFWSNGVADSEVLRLCAPECSLTVLYCDFLSGSQAATGGTTRPTSPYW